MILQLSNSGHYPDVFVEVTEEDLVRIKKIEGNGFLSDTDEGEELLEELMARPHIVVYPVIAYI